MKAETITVQLSHSLAYRAMSHEWSQPGAIESVLPSVELNQGKCPGWETFITKQRACLCGLPMK